jgi:hypothetical protein
MPCYLGFVLCQTLLIAIGEKDIDRKLWIIQKNRIRKYQPKTDIEADDQKKEGSYEGPKRANSGQVVRKEITKTANGIVKTSSL